MRRVLVFTPDLIFFSQVRGTAEAAQWRVERFPNAGLPDGGLDGDVVVIDATRELERAWEALERVKPACPWVVIVCHPHKEMALADEALRRGATDAVRRGALLARLAERLGHPPPGGQPFVGAPPADSDG